MSRLCAAMLLLLVAHQTGASLPPVGVFPLRHAAARRAFFEKTGGSTKSPRQVLFRGINVVYKDAPFFPALSTFHSNLSFVEADVKLLRALGVNLVRLGVMWPGVHPTSPGQSDEAYLRNVERLIALAERHGIYTLLEPHQDELHPAFCGEGAPDWWVFEHNASAPVVQNFPVPVQSTPFHRSPPTRSECYSHSSFSYIFTEDAGRAYQRLYQDSANPRSEEAGIEDGPFAAFWKLLAQRFAPSPSVLGGEIWNEPFPGDVFAQPSFRDNKVADRRNLQPWYANITRAVRREVAEGEFLLAYEPSWPVGDQDLHPESLLTATSGFDFSLNGEQTDSRAEHNFFRDSIYAFHYYVAPCNPNLTEYVAERLADAQRLEAVPLVSEFNLAAWDRGSERRLAATIDVFEQEHQVGYTGWQYKSYSGSLPDGTCTGCGNSFFKKSGALNVRMVRAMGGRPFAGLVAGELEAVASGEDGRPPPPPDAARVADQAGGAGGGAASPQALVWDGVLVRRSVAFESLARSRLAHGGGGKAEGDFIHRFFEMSFLVGAGNDAATEISLSELWLSTEDGSALEPLRQRCSIRVEALGLGGSGKTPRYALVSVERRDAEVVVPGEVVIPASSTVVVAPQEDTEEERDQGKSAMVDQDDASSSFRVTVRLEFWAELGRDMHVHT